MPYKITVIIPCYNCENTLDRAVDSVINQSFGFENIELILYDDFSSDNTRNIITEYSNQYPNIIPIFSNNNSGYPGKGRNEGIKYSTTDYIMFMDNDDEFDRDICKNLFQKINQTNVDLVSCSFVNLTKDSTLKCNFSFHQFDNKTNNTYLFNHNNTVYFQGWLIWCCIFKKNIIVNNNIQFPEDNSAEDVYFLSLYKLYAESIIYIEDYFGVYRHVQEDSMSNSLNLYKINRLFDVYENILLIFDKESKNLDYSLIFEDRINITLYQLYLSGVSDEPKEKLYTFFDRFKRYQKRINYKNSNNMILNFANNLILKNHFFLARIYLKCLGIVYSSHFMSELLHKVSIVYRKIF